MLMKLLVSIKGKKGRGHVGKAGLEPLEAQNGLKMPRN